jgi:hypothetical protein
MFHSMTIIRELTCEPSQSLQRGAFVKIHDLDKSSSLET